MNQLLRLPLLKCTHTHTHAHTHTHTRAENIYIYIYILKKKIIIIIIKRKTVPSSLPKIKKDSYNTPDGGPHGNSQGIGAVNCCRKDLYPRCRTYPRFSSFLCKCNLTKS